MKASTGVQTLADRGVWRAFCHASAIKKEEGLVYPAKNYFLVLVLVLALVSEFLVSGCLSAAAQSNPTPPAPGAANPQLDHFDVSQIDRSLNPCVDLTAGKCRAAPSNTSASLLWIY